MSKNNSMLITAVISNMRGNSVAQATRIPGTNADLISGRTIELGNEQVVLEPYQVAWLAP